MSNKVEGKERPKAILSPPPHTYTGAGAWTHSYTHTHTESKEHVKLRRDVCLAKESMLNPKSTGTFILLHVKQTKKSNKIKILFDIHETRLHQLC